MKKAYSLLELLIVVTIVGILASLGSAQYAKTREKVFDKQAMAQLQLIYSMEKSVRSEGPTYVNCNSNSPCASTLNLSLDKSAGWDYCVSGNAANFCASAKHRYNKYWSIYNVNNTVFSGNCPTACW